MSLLEDRRFATSDRLSKITQLLKDGDWRMPDFACVYATGSFGRGEAGILSDLDLFIVSNPRKESSENASSEREQFKTLDLICVMADLIRATGELGIPPFDSDGEYLAHYEVKTLVSYVGKPYDDAVNTFTARLLLLLESTPLIGVDTYDAAVDAVIGAYWRDFDGHESAFIPAYLANDILRLWRTLCVNYEARTAQQPESKNIKRRIKNYKLKHARLLTCYSALFYLLHHYEQFGTVTKEHAKQMVKFRPTERLEMLRDSIPKAKDELTSLLNMYTEYLLSTDDAGQLSREFADPVHFRNRIEVANQFGDCAARVIEKIGRGTRLHRMLLV